MDLNADGHLDYLTATFDGSPHIAWGSAEGFAEPEQLLDAEGHRILISSFWDWEQRKHLQDGRAFGTDDAPKERCVSAWAHDMDGDGDLDLLLGSYENGHLYVRMNEGTPEKPAFAGTHSPVMAGKVPFALPGKMTAPRMVDWDGDGDLDLVAGSFGDTWGHETEGGRIVLARNIGNDGRTAFGPLETIVEAGRKGGTAPTRPDAGLYVDPVDWDGDGDLDLVVGGYSLWTPPLPDLTGEQQAEAQRLKEAKYDLQMRQAAVRKEYSEARAAHAPDEGESVTSEAQAALDEATRIYREKSAALAAELKPVVEALEELVPSPQREGFVWLYERR